jgi:hypothetical protein
MLFSDTKSSLQISSQFSVCTVRRVLPGAQNSARRAVHGALAVPAETRLTRARPARVDTVAAATRATPRALP